MHIEISKLACGCRWGSVACEQGGVGEGGAVDMVLWVQTGRLWRKMELGSGQ